jgi:stress response protein YsnF
MFDQPGSGQAALRDIRGAGFPAADVNIVDEHSPTIAAGTFDGRSVMELLTTVGVPPDEAAIYAESVRRGASLLMVRTHSTSDADRAMAIINRHDLVDIDRRGVELRASGWTGFNTTTAPETASPDIGQNTSETITGASVSTAEGDGAPDVPVVEEQFEAGDQAIAGGGVRVETHVQETPVNQQVTLREETVDVQRRPAGRPVSEADIAVARQGTVEVRAQDEQAVVDKHAVVREEVVKEMNVPQRTATVGDTTQGAAVVVEELQPRERIAGQNGTAVRPAAAKPSNAGSGGNSRGNQKGGGNRGKSGKRKR